MNRKEGYKDLKKFRETCNKQTRKYYDKTVNAKNKRKLWTKKDEELILEHKILDRELSKILGRSMKAIHVRRTKLKKGETNEK